MRPRSDRAGRTRLPILRPAVVALVVSGLGFALIACLVSLGATDRFDRWVMHALRTAGAPDDPLGPAWISRFISDITHAGGRSLLGLIGLVAAGLLAVLRDWRGVAFLALSLLGGSALASLLKQLFERERPDFVPHLAQVTSLSFPSGHATYSALAYLTFCLLLFRAVRSPPARIYLATAAALIVLLIGFSRIWLGVHYPSDVLAGWCAGIAWASACWLGTERLAGPGPPGST